MLTVRSLRVLASLLLGLTALGAAVWDALLLGAGWYLGANWERVAGVVGPVSAAVLAVALVAAAVPAIGWWGRRGG